MGAAPAANSSARPMNIMGNQRFPPSFAQYTGQLKGPSDGRSGLQPLRFGSAADGPVKCSLARGDRSRERRLPGSRLGFSAGTTSRKAVAQPLALDGRAGPQPVGEGLQALPQKPALCDRRQSRCGWRRKHCGCTQAGRPHAVLQLARDTLRSRRPIPAVWACSRLHEFSFAAARDNSRRNAQGRRSARCPPDTQHGSCNPHPPQVRSRLCRISRGSSEPQHTRSRARRRPPARPRRPAARRG